MNYNLYEFIISNKSIDNELVKYFHDYNKNYILFIIKHFRENELLPLSTIELWDSFSNNIQLWSKRLLKNCDVEIMLKGGKRMGGEYLFTIDACHGDVNMVDASVSEVPSEHKQHNFCKLDNGQFFAQPNNRMLWYEQSLTPKELKRPDFQVSTRNFFCEQESKWAFGDSNDYFYEDKERDVKGKDEYNNE